MSDDDLNQISDEFQTKVRERFETVWMSLSEPEQTLCAGLLTSSDVSRQEMHIARKLVRRGYVVEVEREYNLFGRAFEKFVADKMDIELEPEGKRAKRALDAGKKQRWWKFWKT